MHLNNATANILNTFNKQNINILYDPQCNIFDVILSECGLRLFSSKDPRFVNISASSMRMLRDDQFDLFNYNISITNSIIKHSGQNRNRSFHINTVIVTHSYRPPQIKKEDIVLINRNLRQDVKIFPTYKTADSWKLDRSHIIPYGIPLNKLYPETTTKKNKQVLLLNLDNNQNIDTLAQVLKNNSINVDVLNQMSMDIDLLRALFAQYDVCVDLNDHNIINLLGAISCGCKSVTYATPMIMENYLSTPNLYVASTIQDLISVIQRAASSAFIDPTEYLEKNHPFDAFKEKINNLVSETNNRAFII